MNEELFAALTTDLIEYDWSDGERGGIHASDVGNCLRQTYYKLIHQPVDSDKIVTYKRKKFMFMYGQMWEKYMTRLFSRLGIPWRKENVHERSLNLFGETDPIISYKGKQILLEMKATHEEHFNFLYKEAVGNRILEQYYPQIQTYLWLKPEIEIGAMQIANRNYREQNKTNPFFFYEVTRDEVWRQNNFERRLPMLNDHLHANEVPQAEYDPVPNRFPCSYCPYRDSCLRENKQ